jgi:hypothetical protein
LAPTQIGYLVSLIKVYLGDNELNGTIPSQFGKLTDLKTLFLDRNNLNGTIPAEMNTNNYALDTLYAKYRPLASNQLEGISKKTFLMDLFLILYHPKILKNCSK